jgi:double-stranded uracil-DNA glycosylase
MQGALSYARFSASIPVFPLPGPKGPRVWHDPTPMTYDGSRPDANYRGRNEAMTMQPPFRPTRAQVMAAHDKTVPDLIGPNLRVLFVGINPGLYTAAIGHHFGRPGNRFWPAMHLGGFTRRLLSPFESAELLADGYGITNLVARATATAAELSAQELVAGAKRLVRKLRRYRPAIAAVVGLGAYRVAFGKKDAAVGRQEQRIGDTVLWVLPNPSGLNAHFQVPELGRLFGELRRFADELVSS